MFTLSSEDGTNEDNTFDFEQQQQQQQQQNNDYNKDNKQKKKALITKTSPQQDGQKVSELFLPFISKFTCRQQIR